MKVILLKDIPKVGKKFEIKDISDGHVTNFLLPKGLVSIATANAVAKIKAQKDKEDGERKIQADLLVKSMETLKNSKVTISGKANEKGHLFAGISKEMLIEEISKQIKLNLEPEFVVLEKPIKEVGEHKVTIQAMGKKVELTVVIENK